MVARWQWKEVSSWQVGPYRLNHDGILTLGGVAIPLSPLQGRLLLCFVRHAGQLIERGQLMEEVWGHRRVSDVSLARAVHSLRQVLDRGPLGGRVISTSYGSGYVFSGPVLSLSQAADGGGKSTLSPQVCWHWSIIMKLAWPPATWILCS
jgi:DNA-binding winged helix-turn-helix (wHTH) protein